MKVLALFADNSASEVSLELYAPDPTGDPVKATVVGAQDAAILTSAERAVKCAYSLLLKRRLNDPSSRYFAAFDLDLPAGTPFSGDSAGLAFFLKFIATVLEDTSGAEALDQAVAATGVISGASSEARVERVEGIHEKIVAAARELPGDAAILLPESNLRELEESGEIDQFDAGLVARLKPVSDLDEALEWLLGLAPAISRAPAFPASAAVHPETPAEFGDRYSDSLETLMQEAPVATRKEGLPLWARRIVLFAAAFLITLLIAQTWRVVRNRSSQEGAHPPISPTPTPEIGAPTAPVPPAALMEGALRFQIAAGDDWEEWDWAKIRARRGRVPDLPAGTRFSFHGLIFDADTHFHIFSSQPEEPSFACLFPGVNLGEDAEGKPVRNPLSAGRVYHVPAADRSFEIPAPPPGGDSQPCIFYLVTSGAPLDKLVEQSYNVANALTEKGAVQARAELQRFMQILQQLGDSVRVQEIHFVQTRKPDPR